MNPHRQASQYYHQMGQASVALGASPHQLILLLLDGARNKLAQADHAHRLHDNSQRSQHLHRCSAIIDALRMALDRNRGGSIAESLEQLYDYLHRRLLLLQTQHDASLVQEIDSLLDTLRDGWASIAPQSAAA